jgi:hypothetical protein
MSWRFLPKTVSAPALGGDSYDQNLYISIETVNFIYVILGCAFDQIARGI